MIFIIRKKLRKYYKKIFYNGINKKKKKARAKNIRVWQGSNLQSPDS
jgi:hypothetical protein